MNSLKVVIISRTIFPKIAPRSMRATELAKEFALQGHDVTLYGLLGKYNYKNFQKDTNVKVRSLGKPWFAKSNSDETYTYNLMDKILKRIFGKIIEFPDIELSLNTFKVLKAERDIDLLISIAIPYPIHWGVALYKSLFPNKLSKTIWVADCGDPYMGNPFHKKKFYFKYVEKWFCRKADFISVPIEEAKEAYYLEFRSKIKVIPQGFSFGTQNLKDNYIKNKIPTFVYAGTFYPQKRDPSVFLEFLVESGKDFRFLVFTKSKSFVSKYKVQLGERLIINDYIPRSELLVTMSKAEFVINIENDSTLQAPSKLIDYALTERPILSLNTSKKLDKELILEFLEGEYKNSMEIVDIQKYNIKNVVLSFLNLTQIFKQ